MWEVAITEEQQKEFKGIFTFHGWEVEELEQQQRSRSTRLQLEVLAVVVQVTVSMVMVMMITVMRCSYQTVYSA